jgi:hypothetical protein
MWLVVVLVTTLVSIADLVAAMMIHSVVVALMSVGLCVLGIVLLMIDTVREHPRLDPGSTESEQALPVEHPHTAGDELFGEPEVARHIAREERMVSPDMLGYDVPHEEVFTTVSH